MKWLIFAASLRKNSYNKKLSLIAKNALEDKGQSVCLIDLLDYPMPFYNEDFEKSDGQPKEVTAFRKLMIESDGIVIVSPEYNSSIPGLLKNSLDFASRDEKGNPSRAAFEGKTFLLMGASPSKMGACRAQPVLEAIILELKGKVAKEKFTLPEAHTLFDQPNPEGIKALKKRVDDFIEQNLR